MDAIGTSGLKKIIWIDDDFYQKDSNDGHSAEKAMTLIESLIDTGIYEDLQALAFLSHIDFSLPKAILLSSISAVVSTLDHNNLTDLLLLASDGDDSSTGDIESISDYVNRSGIELIKMSLTDWRRNSQKYLDLSEDVLFLIDKEFDKEGEADDAGTQLLADMIKSYNGASPPNFILFTHTCNNSNEEELLRRDIYNHFKSIDGFEVQSFNFQVLSKSVAYDKDAVGPRFFGCIRAIFVRKIFSEMAHGLKREILHSINEVTDKLISTNVYALDKAVFGSSFDEGVSELDLLHRIYSLSQKRAVSRLISNTNDVVDKLTKLRQLSLKSKSHPHAVNLNFDDFKALRTEEFWHSGDDINKIFSALTCGDVFKLKNREFILLSQACDTILRSNGKRKSNSAVIVPIKRHSFPDDKEFTPEFYKIKSEIHSFVLREMDSEFSFLQFKLNEAIPIHLDTLDLCTFNPSGRVEFSVNQALPALLYNPGQIKRFNRLLELSVGNSFPAKLCSEQGIYPKDYQIPDLIFKDNTWTSDIFRTRRLDLMYAEHALTRFFAYRARKAFDHDFTKH